MSLLPYENLPQVHRADILMKNTVFGLQDHFQFLERGKKYLKAPRQLNICSGRRLPTSMRISPSLSKAFGCN